MTREELELLAQLEQAASEGPWYVRHFDDDMCMGAIVVSREPGDNMGESMRAGTWPGNEVIAACLLQSPPYVISDDDKFEENAVFIAKMRNALPELIRLARMAISEH